MKKSFAFIPVFAMLGGCTAYSEISTAPVNFAQVSRAVVVVDKTEMNIRTFVKDSKNRSAELTGAKCTARSSQFKASFSTPARVNFPVVKGKPENLVLTCRSNGKVGQQVIKPRLKGAGAASAGGNILAQTALTGLANGIAKSRDQWILAPLAYNTPINLK